MVRDYSSYLSPLSDDRRKKNPIEYYIYAYPLVKLSVFFFLPWHDCLSWGLKTRFQLYLRLHKVPSFTTITTVTIPCYIFHYSLAGHGISRDGLNTAIQSKWQFIIIQFDFHFKMFWEILECFESLAFPNLLTEANSHYQPSRIKPKVILIQRRAISKDGQRYREMLSNVRF